MASESVRSPIRISLTGSLTLQLLRRTAGHLSLSGWQSGRFIFGEPITSEPLRVEVWAGGTRYELVLRETTTDIP